MNKQDAGVDFVRTRQETAKILGISVRTLTRLEQRGEAPPRVKISDRIIGYRTSAIDQFLNARTMA